MNKYKKILTVLGIALLFAFGISITIGEFNGGDTYAYYVFGEYIYTHTVIPMKPFNLTKPQTLFPPVYASFLWPLMHAAQPWNAWLVPFAQFLLLIISSFLLFRIYAHYMNGTGALIGTIFFLLLPYNLIYATFMMSETLTSFLITVYTYVLWAHTRRVWWATPSLLLGVTVVATLTRYALLPLMIIHAMLYMISLKKGWRSHHVIGVIGFVIIGIWGLFNYSLYGKFGLSNVTGRHLYNNVVYEGKLIPKSDSSVVKPFLKWGVDITSLNHPWWETQMVFNDGILPERAIDDMFLYVSIAAIQQHPVAWIAHVIKTALHVPNTIPDHPLSMQTELAQCSTACRISWDQRACTPTVWSCNAQSIWSSWIALNDSLYPYVTSLLLLVGLIGCIAIMIRGDTFLRTVALLFVCMHLFQSATEWISGRFLIPLYPFYAILLMTGFEYIRSIFIKTKEA